MAFAPGRNAQNRAAPGNPNLGRNRSACAVNREVLVDWWLMVPSAPRVLSYGVSPVLFESSRRSTTDGNRAVMRPFALCAIDRHPCFLIGYFRPVIRGAGEPLGRRAAPSSRHLRFEALEERIALTIVAGGDGSQNTTAPADDPGFANIGIRGSGSAVYLGDGWVLTATHVGAGVTYLDSDGVLTAYNAVPNSAINLVNPTGAGYTQYSDLTLYQIDGRPDLPSISIGSVAPSVGWSVVMIGNGRDREPSEVYWTSTWQPSATPSTYAGYLWDTSMQDIRWGTNVISSVNMMEGVDTDSETAFGTTFTANVANEGTGSWGAREAAFSTRMPAETGSLSASCSPSAPFPASRSAPRPSAISRTWPICPFIEARS